MTGSAVIPSNFPSEPRFICKTVRSCKQKSNWDCGVTCVLSVLDSENYRYFINNFQAVCKEQKFNKSTWSIDLCYLLKRFNVNHVYCTRTLGINPDYTDHDFYHRILSKDSERVLTRFSLAKKNGITIIQKAVDFSDIIRHVFLHGPVIILTDANSLTCDECKLMRLPGDFSCFSSSSKIYNGHFVIVVGYNTLQRKVYYRNPYFKERTCVTSFKSLDSAWKHEGTDQDTIFIYHYNSGGEPIHEVA